MQAWEERYYDMEEARENGIREGIKEGMKEGMKEGIREGIKEGIKEGIRVLIADNLEEKKEKHVILQKLEKRFSLSAEEAERYYEEYLASL